MGRRRSGGHPGIALEHDDRVPDVLLTELWVRGYRIREPSSKREKGRILLISEEAQNTEVRMYDCHDEALRHCGEDM